jgi:hypothetical protein
MSDQVSARSSGHTRSTVWRFSGSVVKRIQRSTMFVNETLFVFANASRLCTVDGCRSRVPSIFPLDIKWSWIGFICRWVCARFSSSARYILVAHWGAMRYEPMTFS